MKLLIWLIYPVAEAVIQAYLQVKRNWTPHYGQLAVIRGMVAIVFAGAVLRMPYDMVLWWSFVGFAMGSFFVIFDPLLQVIKGWLRKQKPKPFGYTGKRSGWINRIIGERKWLYIVFYCFCFVLAVASFMIGFKHF